MTHDASVREAPSSAGEFGLQRYDERLYQRGDETVEAERRDDQDGVGADAARPRQIQVLSGGILVSSDMAPPLGA